MPDSWNRDQVGAWEERISVPVGDDDLVQKQVGIFPVHEELGLPGDGLDFVFAVVPASHRHRGLLAEVDTVWFLDALLRYEISLDGPIAADSELRVEVHCDDQT